MRVCWMRKRKAGVFYRVNAMICSGKGPQTGFTVSHSHRRTKRSFRPNLQSVRTTIDGENTRLRVCVKCLKAGKVQRVAA